MKFILVISVVLLSGALLLSACSSENAVKETDIVPDDTVDEKLTDSVKEGDVTEKAAVENEINLDQLKEFTVEELAEYNGSEGKPAYVALNGLVYDVTIAKAWLAGIHNPHSTERIAGRDLTEEFEKAPPTHQRADFFKSLPVVGKLN